MTGVHLPFASEVGWGINWLVASVYGTRRAAVRCANLRFCRGFGRRDLARENTCLLLKMFNVERETRQATGGRRWSLSQWFSWRPL